MRWGQLLRLFYINRILLRHGLDEIIFATHLFRPLRLLWLLSPSTWLRKRDQRPSAERVRCALEDLGPIFVKFGQMLSTRPDLLPPDLAKELALLQDRVPPFSSRRSVELIEEAYGKPISEVFAWFDEKPLASASIAQVHPARLHDGREVIVKVVRPDIAPTIRRDVSLLYTLAELAERYWGEAKRLRPVEIVAEYEKTILDELDLMREAASASQLRRFFQDSELLYVPEVHWPLTRSNVMVMERIRGIPISDTASLRAQGVDLVQLSERGVEIFFTQVFKYNFFHADMHPGNIFVAPERCQYIAVDFGIMGTLNPEDQRYLAENFLAFFNRDYRRVAQLHVESGWVPAGTRVDEFESAMRTVCEPIFERPLKDISFGQLLLRLFQTARRFNMEVQPQLVLLQKTLLNIEGLGRELNPELDLWRTAKPFLERWMRDRVGVAGVFTAMRERAPGWIEKLPEWPGLMYGALDAAREYHQAQKDRGQELALLRREMRETARRNQLTLAGAALLLGGLWIVAGMQVQEAWRWFGWAMLIAGCALWWTASPKGDRARGR